MSLLLILDIDETLLHATEQSLARPCDFKVGDYYVYRRPGLEAFLRLSASQFKLAVWSSSGGEYLQAVVSEIFPADIELEFVWDRDRCTIRRDYSGEGESEYYHLKNLKKVKKQGFSLKRTLIVDDTPQKVNKNYGNAIYIKEFEGDEADLELAALSRYLVTLKDEENVRLLEKRGWHTRV